MSTSPARPGMSARTRRSPVQERKAEDRPQRRAAAGQAGTARPDPDPSELLFRGALERVLAFRSRHGRLPAPAGGAGPEELILADWLDHQRQWRTEGGLPPWKEDELDGALGVCWWSGPEGGTGAGPDP